MVLYFRAKEDLDREREDHQRTKAENEELRAVIRERLEAVERERAEERTLFMEQLRLLGDEIRELRAQRNGNGGNRPDDAPA